jgi:osmotically inducible protein OsmC
MAVRKASAKWTGTLKEGAGTVTTGLGEHPYSFSSRFEDGTGTNPEELLGAAHAGCFSMALNASLERAGHNAQYVNTTARVHLTKGDSGFSISKIELVTEAAIPGIREEEFLKFAEEAKANCVISRALGAVEEVTLDATLITP